LLSLLFEPEDVGSTIFHNAGELLPGYTASPSQNIIHFTVTSNPTTLIIYVLQAMSMETAGYSETITPISKLHGSNLHS
jgi:hypothetical protein